MSTMARLLSAAVLLLSAASPIPASGPDDEEDREERLAVGRLAYRDNCLMCHSEEMVGRARLTQKQWATEIDKMIGWGSPLPAESKGFLLEYLTSQFSDPKATPVAPPKRITLREALAQDRPQGVRPIQGDPAKGATLFAANCATCHGPQARGGDLGVCLVEKPMLLRPEDFAGVVRKGRRRMPGFEAALKTEAEWDILAWLRAQRFEAPAP